MDINSANPFFQNLKKNSEENINKNQSYTEMHGSRTTKAKKSAHIRIEDLGKEKLVNYRQSLKYEENNQFSQF